MKIIVLDTNIWISELALMSPTGCALRYFISINDLKIGLPEVIELEVQTNLKKNLQKYREEILKNYNRMLAIFGKMYEVVLPSDKEIEKKINEVFDCYADRIIRVPFDLESARSSFEKIVRKEPPNFNDNQQFKDGVIWANCLKLLELGDVLFVAKDRGFFKNMNFKEGLAENLLNEAKQLHNNITVLHELNELLKRIRKDVNLDQLRLVQLVENLIYQQLLEIAQRQYFDIGKIAEKEFKFYATVKPEEVSVKFLLKYSLGNKLSEYRIDAYLESKGEFILDVYNYQVSNFLNLGEQISWIDETGEVKEHQNVYLSGNLVIGHRTIEHQVKYKLE